MRYLLNQVFNLYKSHIGKLTYYTCMVTFFIVLIERFFIVFSYEPYIAGIDNNFIYPIIRALAGESIYPNPEDFPYAVNPYAPLFFLLCKYIGLLFNVDYHNTISVYWLSRSVCLLVDFATCFVLYNTLKKLMVNRPASILSMALFFCVVSFLGYTINRCDSLFLFFYSATIYTLVYSNTKQHKLTPLLLAILTTLCIFSKQNAISLLLIVPIWLFYNKAFKQLIMYVLLSALFLSTTFFYFELQPDQYFSRQIIDSLKNKIDPQWFYVYIFKIIAPSYISLPIVISIVVSVKALSKDKPSVLQSLGLIAIVQFFISTALSFKWGSSVGYFNENFLLSALILAHASTSLSKSNLSQIAKIGVYTYPALIAYFLHITSQLYFFYLNDSASLKTKYHEQVEIGHYIKKNIQPESYVLDLSDADYNFFKNILFKESVAPNIDAIRCCTLPDEIFDYTGLKNGLENGKISYLIERKNDHFNEVWGAKLHHYEKDTTFSYHSIYKYKKKYLENHK